MLLSKYKIRLNQLYCRKKKNSGRNNTGRITVAHQGSGHKQQYRKIDFSGDFFEGTVINIEYDPNRTARIAKICTTINNKKKYFYIIAPKNIKIFDKVISTKYKNISANKQKYSGSFYFLKDLFTGDLVFNLEMYPMKGGQFVRTAGAFAKILQKSEEGVIVKLPSGEHRLFSEDCRACLGTVSNEDYFNEIVGKAGRSR
jgi:large subunit ribosomal protein L2